MKCFFLPAAALFLSTLVMAQKNDIATLEKLNYSWLAAYPKRDTAILSKILADDFILVNPAGAKKTTWTTCLTRTLKRCLFPLTV